MFQPSCRISLETCTIEVKLFLKIVIYMTRTMIKKRTFSQTVYMHIYIYMYKIYYIIHIECPIKMSPIFVFVISSIQIEMF